MKNFVKILVLVGLVTTLYLTKSGTANAASGPFVCSSNFYQVISGQLNTLNPLTGAYTPVGNQQADTYNAIGYNVLDNYIYGIKTSVTDGIGAIGDLVRISSDGTLTDLGAVTGLPVAGYVNGSTDLSGNMYIRTDVHTIYKINISTLSATALTISGDTIIGANENVFINNKLYFLLGNTLSVVDLLTNNATTGTVTGPSGWLNSSTGFGAGWTDQAGELFFSNNGSGSIYQITDLSSPTPTATFKVAGTVTSNNDGASCPLGSQSPFDAPVAVNDNYSTMPNTRLNETATSLLSNDMGNVLTVTSHTNPSHGTVTVNSDGTFIYTPANNFSGLDSFAYTVTDSFGRTTTATVTITVSSVIHSALKSPDTGFGKPMLTNSWTMINMGIALSISLIALGLGLLRRFKTSSN